MEKILKVKEQGNKAFKAQKFADAITCYEEALVQVKFRKQDIAKETFTEEEQAKLKKLNLEEQLEDTHQALLNNLAMCFQKKNKAHESAFYNDQCLQLNPKHVKARYRKVQLLKAEAKFEEAIALAKELAADDAG